MVAPPTVVSLPGVGKADSAVAMTTAPKDKKLYRRVSLANGLRIILISDPEMADQVGGGSDSEAESSGSQEGSESAQSEEEDDEVRMTATSGLHIRACMPDLHRNLERAYHNFARQAFMGVHCRAQKTMQVTLMLPLALSRRQQQLWQSELGVSKIQTTCRYGRIAVDPASLNTHLTLWPSKGCTASRCRVVTQSCYRVMPHVSCRA